VRQNDDADGHDDDRNDGERDEAAARHLHQAVNLPTEEQYA
jgi:hypothetical protein